MMRCAVNTLCEPSPIIGRWRNNAGTPTPEINPLLIVADWWCHGDNVPNHDDLGRLFGGNEMLLSLSASPPAQNFGGKFGTCNAFIAASEQYFFRADEAALRVPATGDLTFAAWVYPTSATSGIILAKNDEASSALEYSLTLVWPSGRYNFTLEADGYRYQVVTTGSVALNTWHLVICWLDRTRRECGIMVNATAPRFDSNPGPGVGTVGASFTIGAREVAASPFYFDGRLEQVCRWNRLLNPAERAALFTTSLTDLQGVTFFAASDDPPDDYPLPSVVPDAPSGLALSIDLHTVTLEWINNAVNALGIEIWRKVRDGDYALAYTANAYLESTWTDTESDTDTDWYTYKIRAVNYAGASDYSDEATTSSGSTTLTDDFNRANGSLGADWTEEIGNFGVVSNQAWALDESFSRNTAVHVTPLDGVDHYVRIRAHISASAYPGVVFRYVDDASGHYVVDWDEDQIYWSYYPDIGGAARNIINGAAIAFTSGNYVGITVIGTGAATRVRIWLDTTAAAPDAGGTTWDSAAPDINQLVDGGPYADAGTMVGISQWWNTPSGNAQIDDFSAGTF